MGSVLLNLYHKREVTIGAHFGDVFNALVSNRSMICPHPAKYIQFHRVTLSGRAVEVGPVRLESNPPPFVDLSKELKAI